MTEMPAIRPDKLSRRSLLRRLAVTAGGTALLGTTILASGKAEAAKMAQTVVGYQDTPKGAQQCDNCSQFEAPASCKIVDGAISPSGWCKVYVKKPA
jgi:hypothetical protein